MRYSICLDAREESKGVFENLKRANDVKKKGKKNKREQALRRHYHHHPRPLPLLLLLLLLLLQHTSRVQRKEKKKKIVNEQKEIRNENSTVSKRKVFVTIAENSICPNCFKEEIECQFTNRQIDCRVRLFCRIRKYVIVDNNEDSELSVKQKGIHAVTLAFVYAIMLLGHGYQGFLKVLLMQFAITIWAIPRAICIMFLDYYIQKYFINI